MSTDRELEEIFDDITTGMYVSQDGDEFTPVRWENSPLRQKYLDRLKSLITEATREAEMERLETQLRILKKPVRRANDVGFRTDWRLTVGKLKSQIETRLKELQRTKNKEEGATWPVDTNENKRIIP